MSNFSDSTRRLLHAVAGESRKIAGDVAKLGEFLSAGMNGEHASIVAVQSFDYLVQQASALARLTDRLADDPLSQEEIVSAIAGIPLPAVRERLFLALDMPAIVFEDDEIFWSDT